MAGTTWTPEAALQDTEWSLAIKLLRARELVMQRFRPHLRRHELTEQQWRVLRVLAEGGWLEMQELSRRCLILAPSLSRIVPSLEGRRLVERRSVSTDGRRNSVSLTPGGRALFNEVAAGSEPLYAEIGEQLGARTVEDLFRALDALIAKLGEGGTPRA